MLNKNSICMNRHSQIFLKKSLSKSHRADECIQSNPGFLTYAEVIKCIHNLSGEDENEIDLYFYHSDHIGSSSFITDRNEIASQHLQYLPFGEPNRPKAVSLRTPLNYNKLSEQLFVEQRSTANYYTNVLTRKV